MSTEKQVEMPLLLAQELCNAIDLLKPHHHLENWIVNLNQSVVYDDEYGAWIKPTFGKHSSVITLCDGWFEQTYDRRTQFLCHELCHLHFAEQDSQLEILLKQNLSPNQLEIASELISLRQEYIVDDLAVAFAALLPKSTITLLEKLYKKLDRWWKTVN